MIFYSRIQERAAARKLIYYLIAVSFLGAWQSAPPEGTITYKPADNSFSCAVPGRWRLLENHGGALVTLFGPPSGPKPYSATIAVYRYTKADYPSPEDYFKKESVTARRCSALIEKHLGDKSVRFFSLEKELQEIHSTQKEAVTEECYLISRAGGGLYSLVYLCSKDATSQSEPVFQNLAETFKIL